MPASLPLRQGAKHGYVAFACKTHFLHVYICIITYTVIHTAVVKKSCPHTCHRS